MGEPGSPDEIGFAALGVVDSRAIHWSYTPSRRSSAVLNCVQRAAASKSMTLAPSTGRWRAELNWNDARQPLVTVGSSPALRAARPATGCDATCRA